MDGYSHKWMGSMARHSYSSWFSFLFDLGSSTLGQTMVSIALEVQEDHKLITTGPYKSVRHLMYLGLFFLYTIGLMMISLDVFVILFFSIFNLGEL